MAATDVGATEIPGPAGDRLLGNLQSFATDPLAFLTRCARTYGDVVRIGEQNVLLTHPSYVERVLVDRASSFVKRGPETQRDSRRQGLPLSTMNSEGDEWRVRRHRVQPAFGRKLTQAAAETVDAQSDRMLTAWKDGDTRDLQADVSLVTLRLVTSLLFGEEFTDGEAEDVARLVGAIMDLSTNPVILPSWIPTPTHVRVRRSLTKVDRALAHVAAAVRTRTPERAPLLHALIGGSPPPSAAEIHDELATMVMAGYETTNDAVVWACVLLAQHPEAAERVHEEARAAFGTVDPGPPRTAALRYTDAVVREALRLYSPVWITSRDAAEDLTFGDHVVPSGTTVTVSQWVNHRDPRFWDRAETFLPERWLDGGPSTVPRGSYFPFGLGPRACIGASVATIETVHIVADIWRRFSLSLAGPAAVRPRPALALQPVNAGFTVRRRG
ncbi:cytochrome P450 [Streptomyces sp. NPDC005435]|uniref:cytochrome P450 n=1 Tax=Streptomyces sp. NPDC005435 TaxID=3154464 RepID=UPI003452DD93